MRSLPVIAAAAGLLLAAAAPGHAQLAGKQALTLEGAKRIMAAAAAEAKKQNFPCSIAIVDDGGNLLLMERLDDWIVASANVSIGKARTSAIFRRPTSDFENIIKNGRTAMVALNDFTPLQGGVPIAYEGKVIGAIGVSGSNPPKDEEIALAGVAALTGAAAIKPAGAAATSPASGSTDATASVSYFPNENVAAAFVKGAVLLNAGDYMIHASHRDKPGMGEVHTLDTDIIYVLKGSATFVTGGTLVEPKEVEPNEIRGSAINGGETRVLSKGDVITVRNGTPHWFKDVRGSFNYYVVKVRAVSGGST